MSSEDVPFRVMVVEDDRSQALFAEAILKGSGFLTKSVHEAAGVMAAIAEFKPDLLLLDLHLPDMPGTELTKHIRALPEYQHLPIVFLSGDQAPERQFEALEVGADDFLRKPIRPRMLIAAVQNRAQRGRTLRDAGQQGSPVAAAPANPETGLPLRSDLLQRITALVANKSKGHCLYVDIHAGATLRDYLGHSGFDQLMMAVGRRLAELATPHPIARLSDSAFLMLCSEHCTLDDARVMAAHLRHGLVGSTFLVRHAPVQILCSVGIVALDNGLFTSEDDVIDAAAAAAHHARHNPDNIAVHAPRMQALDGDMDGMLHDALGDGLRVHLEAIPVDGNQEAYRAHWSVRTHDGSTHVDARVIPQAEARGWISRIEHRLITRTLQTMIDQGCQDATVLLSQSPMTLAEGGLGDWIESEANRLGLPASAITVDIRLEQAIAHPSIVRSARDALAAKGIALSLSGFSHHGGSTTQWLDALHPRYIQVAPHYLQSDIEPPMRDELLSIVDAAQRRHIQVIASPAKHPSSPRLDASDNALS